MKKQVYGAVLTTAMIFGSAAFAQDQQQSAPGAQQQEQGQWKHGRRGMHSMDPQARLDRMAKHLNLTDDQKARIQPIIENSSQQMKALRDDAAADRQARRAKAMEIQKNTMDQIRPILTAEQQQKLADMRQKRMEHRGRHGKRGGQQGGAATTPPQN